MNVHPAAEVFPMLPDDELQELAADIKQNGLHEALKVSGGLLIDGRNRLAACKMAGVEPRIEELNGVDPIDYVLSVNINRRHLTGNQRGMIIAMIHPKPEERGRGKKCSSSEHFHRPTLSMARTVLSVLPELAIQVRDGIVPLREAYAKAQFERQAIELGKTSLQSLRKEAADLADLVDEERMKLPEALAALDQRKDDARKQREATYGLLQKQQVLVETVEGALLTNMIETLRSYPQECPLTKSEIRKLAGRIATGWHKVEEAMK